MINDVLFNLPVLNLTSLLGEIPANLIKLNNIDINYEDYYVIIRFGIEWTIDTFESTLYKILIEQIEILVKGNG